MIKKFVATVAALALAGSVLSVSTPANAAGATPTLTYSDLIQSPGFQHVAALSAASQTAFSKADSMQVTSVVHATTGPGTTADVTVDVRTNHSSAMSTTLTSVNGGKATASTYYFDSGAYIFDQKTYASKFGQTNVANSLKILNKPSNSFISSPTAPAGIANINPAYLFESTGQNGITSLSNYLGSMLFSDAVCVTTLLTPNTELCTYSASVSVPSMGSLLVDVALTYESGLLSTMSVSETSDPSGFELTMSIAIKELSGWAPALPASVVPADSVKTAAPNLKNAQDMVIAMAKSIANSSNADSKKAKKPVTLGTLKTLIKHVGQRYSTIKNGFKLKSDTTGVVGFACLTVVNGKANAKVC